MSWSGAAAPQSLVLWISGSAALFERPLPELLPEVLAWVIPAVVRPRAPTAVTDSPPRNRARRPNPDVVAISISLVGGWSRRSRLAAGTLLGMRDMRAHLRYAEVARGGGAVAEVVR